MKEKIKTRTIKKLKNIITIVENGNLKEKELWQLLEMSQSISATFKGELKELDFRTQFKK